MPDSHLDKHAKDLDATSSFILGHVASSVPHMYEYKRE